MPQVVYTYAFADPARELSVAELQALVRDLIAYRIVDRPCGVVVGLPELPPAPPLLQYASLKKTGTFKSTGLGAMKVSATYLGGDSSELLAAIEEAPLGQQDVSVWFRDFAEDKDFPAPTWSTQAYVWGVALYVLAEPRELELEQGRVLARAFLTAQGEGGPWAEELEETPLTKVLQEHLGSLTLVDS